MTAIRALKKEIVSRLTAAGIEPEEAEVEAELLVEYACGLSRRQQMEFARQDVSQEQSERIRRVVSQREERMPLQYCIGYGWFFGTKFIVRPGVFIPRTDTEIVVDVAARMLRKAGWVQATVGEIGLGTGVISVSLLKLMPSLHMVACDRNPIAVEVSSENARAQNVSDRLEMFLGDWLEVLPKNLDAIVSNPPYIPIGQKSELQPEVQAEPESALFAGADGMDFYRVFAQEGRRFLKGAGSFAVVEVGDGQSEAVVREFMSHHWTDCVVHPDVNGLPRAVCAVV